MEGLSGNSALADIADADIDRLEVELTSADHLAYIRGGNSEGYSNFMRYIEPQKFHFTMADRKIILAIAKAIGQNGLQKYIKKTAPQLPQIIADVSNGGEAEVIIDRLKRQYSNR